MPSAGSPATVSTGSEPSAGDVLDGRSVVHLVAEYWPYARTGGLAEAVHGVANQLQRQGVATSVIMPLYRSIRDGYPDLTPVGDSGAVTVGSRTEPYRLHQAPSTDGEARVYFVESPAYFDRPGIYGEGGADYPDNHRRFALFCRAALEALPEIVPEPPILHAHDWHTSLAPAYLGTVLAPHPWYRAVPVVLTVHNAGFQGHFGPGVLDEVGLPHQVWHWQLMEWYGKVNFLKGGLAYSDMVTTVSPGHAHELRTPAGGFGLHETFISLQDRFQGILNGIDLQVWNPATDPELSANYTVDDPTGKIECKQWLQANAGLEPSPARPLCCMSARLVHQKGIDLILGADLLRWPDVQYIFLGTGEPRYEAALGALSAAAADRIVTRFEFTESREHTLLAGADILMMPSLYEPCGLTQMRAQRYGALPVARRVGGLADTIEDQVTGFLFDDYTPEALERALRRAIGLYAEPESWSWHVREAMSRDFGWGRSASEYLRVYARALSRNLRRQ